MGLFDGKDDDGLRIDGGAEMSLISTAVVLDGFSVVPGLNVFIALIGWPVIMWQFHRHKVPVLKARVVWEFSVGFVIEVTPVASIFPSFYLFTKFLIAHSQNEDRERAERKKSGTAAKRTTVFTD